MCGLSASFTRQCCRGGTADAVSFAVTVPVLVRRWCRLSGGNEDVGPQGAHGLTLGQCWGRLQHRRAFVVGARRAGTLMRCREGWRRAQAA